jgi:hypothetical protein
MSLTQEEPEKRLNELTDHDMDRATSSGYPGDIEDWR